MCSKAADYIILEEGTVKGKSIVVSVARKLNIFAYLTNLFWSENDFKKKQILKHRFFKKSETIYFGMKMA